jgi:hypothetical protein
MSDILLIVALVLPVFLAVLLLMLLRKTSQAGAAVLAFRLDALANYTDD